jgi:single-strand DNA-binding protein
MNRVQLLGRLGADPDLRYIAAGTAVCKLRVATTEFLGKEKKEEKTEWHDIVAWGKQGERCGQSLKKGALVFVEGRLSHRTYDAKDGSKRTVTEVVAQNVIFVDSRGSSESNGGDGNQDRRPYQDSKPRAPSSAGRTYNPDPPDPPEHSSPEDDYPF